MYDDRIIIRSYAGGIFGSIVGTEDYSFSRRDQEMPAGIWRRMLILCEVGFARIILF